MNSDFNIPAQFAGINFRNPFFVASGPTTMTVEQLERIQHFGWGGASLKLTIDPEPYINRAPRYGYYSDKDMLTFTAEKRLLLDELLRLIEAGRKKAPEIILFSNITYSGPDGVDGWVRMAKKCENAGVHVNELNMCCPNMSFNVEMTGKSQSKHKTGASLGQNREAIVEIVRAIKSETDIPLFVKITPEGGSQSLVAQAAIAAGADAVGGNANRLGIPPVNLDDPTSSQYYLQKEIGMACLCGGWIKPLALKDVYSMRRNLGPEAVLTATGGVSTWRDAVEMVMCGADLVGISTGTLVHGFGFMPELIAGFKSYMSEKGYSNPREMRDILVPAVTSAPDLTLYSGHARKKDHNLSAPCTFACPNSVPAQGYVRKVAERKFEEAYQLIMSRSPLQSICGQVCDHPCENECTRGLVDQPVMIRAIKKFVLEMADRKNWKPRILAEKHDRNGLSVAVIGSGPAGLACAYDLARSGYDTVVFEASDTLGGMLTSCIPGFRLDSRILDGEIEVIKKLGVEFRTGVAFGKDITLESLREEGFKAVFLGLGAQQGTGLKIPGENLENCLPAVDFLNSISCGGNPEPGRRVAVIGGGFTALDSARTALRLGAEDVYILYRRTRDEMPAADEEISLAEKEGVRIMYLVAPVEIKGNGKVESVRMLNHVLADTDDRGRRRPEAVPGTEFSLDVDTVITAIGQQALSSSENFPALQRNGSIDIREGTCETSVAGVFAGGDCTGQPGNVISAIADGKRSAVSIDRMLSGDNAVLEYDPEKTCVDRDSVLASTPAGKRSYRPVDADFNAEEQTLTEEQAVTEASRCLACGCGAGCEICVNICKVFAWSTDDSGKTILDEDKCVACGMCLHRCPRNNIEMINTGMKV